MQTLLLSLLITLAVVVGFILLLNFCRRRLSKTPHGLTGLCHKDGGRLCSSCADNLPNQDNGRNNPPAARVDAVRATSLTNRDNKPK